MESKMGSIKDKNPVVYNIISVNKDCDKKEIYSRKNKINDNNNKYIINQKEKKIK